MPLWHLHHKVFHLGKASLLRCLLHECPDLGSQVGNDGASLGKLLDLILGFALAAFDDGPTRRLKKVQKKSVGQYILLVIDDNNADYVDDDGKGV